MLTAGKDQAFLIHFDREVELLQDVTPSRDKLQSALELLRVARSDGDSSPQDSPSGGSRRMHGGSGTLLYDAVFLASNDLMKKQQGRKARIILSDGVDRGSKESLQSAVEAAQHADTVVYSILFVDNHREEGGGFGRPGGGGGMGRAGGGWPGGGGSGGGGRRGGGQRPHKKRALMGRKFSSESPKKRAAVSMRFPRRKQWIKSMRVSRRNCVHSTAWAIRPIKPTTLLVITRLA